MKTVSISVADDLLEEFQQTAQQMGMSAEELLATKFQDWIRESREEFRRAARRVLDKNAELYRRLA